jgi:hypothetical protein
VTTAEWVALGMSIAAFILSLVNGVQVALQGRRRRSVWKFGPPLIQPTRPSEQTLAALDAIHKERR